jgi:hypothetical protein
MSSTTDSIRISTTPTFSAYARFVMWAAFRQCRFLVPFAILALICFLLAPVIPLERQGAMARYRASLSGLILPGMVFVLLPLSSYYAARKRWQNATELRAPRTYVFSDEGVDIAAQSFNSHVAWKHVVTADQHRDQILLGTAQKQFYLVLVDDFESQEQFDRFLELVRSKVANCRV